MSGQEPDIEAIGWHDDGTVQGAIRLVRGDLVRVPFLVGQYQADNTGSTATYQTAIAYNPDGTGTGINVSVPTGAAGVDLWQPFRGRGFGVRFVNGNGHLSVTVDGGQPVGVDTVAALLVAELVTLSDFAGGEVVTHDDLADTWHVARIRFTAPATGTNAASLLGYLAERRAGYDEPKRRLHAMPKTELTTADAVPNMGTAPGKLITVASFLYANLTASPVTVTVKSGSDVKWTGIIPASDSRELVFAGPVAEATIWTHAASANSAVNVTAIGETR